MNKIDTKTRSKIMSKVRSRDTKMELAVRLVMEALGFIYYPKDIVGRPDFANSIAKIVLTFSPLPHNFIFLHLSNG